MQLILIVVVVHIPNSCSGRYRKAQKSGLKLFPPDYRFPECKYLFEQEIFLQ